MKFTDGKQTYEVTDPAHIDCFRAKGWIEVKEKGYGPKELARLVCQDVLDRMHPSFMNVRYQECEQSKIEKEITISSKIIEEAIEIIKEEI